ncbi:MAG: hypothetical protein K2K05_06160 [Muribaculaceae bacterium]|nr:hypothetical protein [Muribaculaceae bacterium]
MNKIQPLDQVRSIVASALNRTAKIRKNFESFFIEFIYRLEDKNHLSSVINSIKVIPASAGIEGIEIDNDPTVVARYLIDGRHAINPVKGSVVIEYLSDGTTRKVIAE